MPVILIGMTMSPAVPAFPAVDVAASARYYVERFGFSVRHQDEGFAIVVRDAAELHLWESGDTSWRTRGDLVERPVCSGAESFLAGTSSCRIKVDDVDALYEELRGAGVLHHADAGGPVDTDFGTREFATIDLDGNLITYFRRP